MTPKRFNNLFLFFMMSFFTIIFTAGIMVPRAYTQIPAEVISAHKENVKLHKSGNLKNYKAAAQNALYANYLNDASLFSKTYLRDFPDDTETILILAQSLLWGGKAKPAVGYYWKYFKKGGEKSPPVLFQYAEGLKACLKFKEAIPYIFEARAGLKTSEADLAAQMNISLGYCYLETLDFNRARLYFLKARNSKLKSEYREAMGDYYNKLFSVETAETYFDYSKKTFEKRISYKNLETALENYRKASGLKPENHAVKIKIADSLWALNEKKKAVETLERAEPLLETGYAPMRLSYFIKEEAGTAEAPLKKSLSLLGKASKYGENMAEIEYDKAAVYETLNDGAGRMTALKKAVKYSVGDEWFLLFLADKLIKAGAETSEISALADKSQKHGKFYETSMLLRAYSFLGSLPDHSKSAHILKDFIAGDGGTKSADSLNFALLVFNALDYEIQLRNQETGREINMALRKISVDEINAKLDFIGKLLKDQTSENNIIRLYETQADLYASLGDNAALAKNSLDQVKYYGNDAKKVRELYLKAFNYRIYSGDTAEAEIVARKMSEQKIYEKEPLKYLIYSNYWGNERKYAEECLADLGKIDPASAVVSTFEGMKFIDESRYFSAAKCFKKALDNGGDKEYLNSQLAAVRDKMRTLVDVNYVYTNDSTRQSRNYKTFTFTMPQDGYKMTAGYYYNKITKNNIFLGADGLTSTLTDVFISYYKQTGRTTTFEAQMSGCSVDGSGGTVNKLFPQIKFFKMNKDVNVLVNYLERFLDDSPLSEQLGIYERIGEAVLNYTSGKLFGVGQFQARRLSDGNSRDTRNISAGYWIRKRLALRMGYSTDNMAHEYAGDVFLNGRQFAPFEVYYAPRHVSANSVGIDFNRNFKNITLSGAVTSGKEMRENGPDSKFHNLSMALDVPLEDGSGVNVNFYGAKSDVDPFSDQTEKSKYIAREIYLKYYQKL